MSCVKLKFLFSFRMGNRLPTSVELSDAAAVNQIQVTGDPQT